eukprot:scaffold1289_cov274-Pinguiococcus_pyrenoidosus.AAC.23
MIYGFLTCSHSADSTTWAGPRRWGRCGRATPPRIEAPRPRCIREVQRVVFTTVRAASTASSFDLLGVLLISLVGVPARHRREYAAAVLSGHLQSV